MLIEKKSMFTGITRTLELDVTAEEYENWTNGMLIQDAMPRLTVEEREYLITGVTPHEWNEFMEREE